MSVDYKQKYIDLRSKLIESKDVAYRLGYEQGMKEGQQAAQQEMMQQQMMMQQQQQQQMMGGGEEQGGGPVDEQGQPILDQGAGGGQEGMPQEGMPQEGMPQEGMPDEGASQEAQSELDNHISELESLVAKGEKPSVLSMRKAVVALSNLRKSQKSKAKHKPQKPKVVTAQKKLVDSIINSWNKDTSSDSIMGELEGIIKQHGIKIE